MEKKYSLRPLPHRSSTMSHLPINENQNYSFEELHQMSLIINRKLAEYSGCSSPSFQPNNSTQSRVKNMASPNEQIREKSDENGMMELNDAGDKNGGNRNKTSQTQKQRLPFNDDRRSSLIYQSEDELEPDDSVSQINAARAKQYDPNESFGIDDYYKRRPYLQRPEIHFYKSKKNDDMPNGPRSTIQYENPQFIDDQPNMDRFGTRNEPPKGQKFGQSLINRQNAANRKYSDQKYEQPTKQVYTQLVQIKDSILEMFNNAHNIYSKSDVAQNEVDDVDTCELGEACRRRPRHIYDSRHEYQGISFNLKFNGKSSFRDFILHFDAVADIEKWSEEDKGRLLLKSLDGAANSVLGSIPASQRSNYSILKEVLSQRYNPRLDSDIAGSLTQTRKRKKGESYLVFVQELKKSVGDANPLWTTDMIELFTREKFFAAIDDPQMRSTLWARQPKSVDEGAIMADALEKLREESSNGQLAIYHYHQNDQGKRGYRPSNKRYEGNPPYDHKYNAQAEAFYPKNQMPKFQDPPSRMQGGNYGPGQNMNQHYRNNARQNGFNNRNNHPSVCYQCQQPGHIRRNCPLNDANNFQGNNLGSVYNGAAIAQEN